MPNRICLTGEGTKTRFGLVMGSDGRSSCTARGRVDRSGPKLAFVVDGDPACALTATLTDTKLDLDAARGKECSYYCGTGTQFQAASFYKSGGFYKAGRTQAEVREVVDLVGEPLC